MFVASYMNVASRWDIAFVLWEHLSELSSDLTVVPLRVSTFCSRTITAPSALSAQCMVAPWTGAVVLDSKRLHVRLVCWAAESKR